jgi:hypothetical protein
MNVNKRSADKRNNSRKNLIVKILKMTGIWEKLRSNVHQNNFHTITKKLGVDNIIADQERLAGNHLIQRFYMLDTLHHAEKLGLLSQEKLKPLEDQLIISILKNVNEWAILRNTLHNNKFRSIWEKID